MMSGLPIDRRSVLAGALVMSSGILMGATRQTGSPTTIVIRQPGYHLSQQFADVSHTRILFLPAGDPMRSKPLAAVLSDPTNRIIGLTDWTAFAALRELGQEYGRRLRHEGKHVPSGKGWTHSVRLGDASLQNALNRAGGQWLDFLTHRLMEREGSAASRLTVFPDAAKTMFSWSMD